MSKATSKANGTKQGVKALDVFYTLLLVLAITVGISMSKRDDSAERPTNGSSLGVTESTKHDAAKEAATQSPKPIKTKIFDPELAANGRRIFEMTIRRHAELDEFYSKIDSRFSHLGAPIGMHLPETDWNEFSESDKESIYHFLQAEDQGNGWRLTVGQIDGMDIRSDELAMSSEMWLKDQTYVPDDSAPEDRRDRESGHDEPNWREAITKGETGFAHSIEKNLLYAEARSFVRDSLVNPSGAKFASPVNDPSVSVYRDEDGIVTVKGWVESSNRLGVQGRTYWSVKMMPTSDHRWILLSLSERD